VIDAYAVFEESGFIIYDMNLMGAMMIRDYVNDGVRPTEYSNQFLGPIRRGDWPARLVYALYDMNSDGVYELIIGWKWENSERVEMSGIYSLQNGAPASAFQEWSRFSLRLEKNYCGNTVIIHTWGRDNWNYQYFYMIDAYGQAARQFILWDGLERNFCPETHELIGHTEYFAINVDGVWNAISVDEFRYHRSKTSALELDWRYMACD